MRSNKIQQPPGCHLAVTLPTSKDAAAFVEAVRSAVALMKAQPELNHSSSVATYGMAAKLSSVDVSYINDMCKLHSAALLDALPEDDEKIVFDNTSGNELDEPASSEDEAFVARMREEHGLGDAEPAAEGAEGGEGETQLVSKLTPAHVKKMKVAELREALSMLGLPTSGLKKVLAERLIEAL